MGCCGSKSVEINNSPQVYHAAEVQPSSSQQGRGSTISTGLLVDTNLDTSIPETYRPPPAPVPYETYVGHPHTVLASHEISGDKDEVGAQGINKPAEETNSAPTQPTTVKDVKPDGNVENDVEVTIVKEVVDDLEKSGDLKKPAELIVSLLEEDVCPTCLEEYGDENPKITTKCEHYFHLACILEWMERSDTCPVCGQEMIYSIPNQS